MAQTPKPKNFKKPGNKRSNIVTIVVFVAHRHFLHDDDFAYDGAGERDFSNRSAGNV